MRNVATILLRQSAYDERGLGETRERLGGAIVICAPPIVVKRYVGAPRSIAVTRSR